MKELKRFLNYQSCEKYTEHCKPDVSIFISNIFRYIIIIYHIDYYWLHSSFELMLLLSAFTVYYHLMLITLCE